MASSAVVKNTVQAGSKRRIKIWMIGIVLFMSWATYTILNQASQQSATKAKLSSVIESKSEIEGKKSELQQQIDRLSDPEYIAQIATKEQGMVKQGEQQIHTE
ncbi:septum formation initiator family protein [Paenibacillus sp. GCM10023252]|uniref:FtsB family cell division protein n=1 Tax=Paenibacillus sp. GCM10023252 TaxID=3252649 RepID=UPI003620EE6B